MWRLQETGAGERGRNPPESRPKAWLEKRARAQGTMNSLGSADLGLIEHSWLFGETKAHSKFSPPRQGFRPPHDGAGSRYQNEPVPVSRIVVDSAKVHQPKCFRAVRQATSIPASHVGVRNGMPA